MAYTVRKLITNSFYLTGIVARGLQTVDGQQLSDGLDLLNDLLAIKTANSRLIPYYSFETINLEVGKETYFVPKLIEISSITFNMGNDPTSVRFSTSTIGRRQYWGSSRVNGMNALPLINTVDRVKGGANISVQFLPQSSYPLNIVGKYGLDEVTVDQDLSLTYDRFYVAYLKYALAQYIAEDYSIPFPQQSINKLNEYESVLLDLSAPDFKMQKTTVFRRGVGYTWWDVNIGKGWTFQ